MWLEKIAVSQGLQHWWGHSTAGKDLFSHGSLELADVGLSPDHLLGADQDEVKVVGSGQILPDTGGLSWEELRVCFRLWSGGQSLLLGQFMSLDTEVSSS